MPDMKLLKTSVSEAAPGELLVEISIADNDDIEVATEHVSLAVRIPAPKSNPLVEEVQLAALRRIETTISRYVAELSPKVLKARERLP